LRDYECVKSGLKPLPQDADGTRSVPATFIVDSTINRAFELSEGTPIPD